MYKKVLYHIKKIKKMCGGGGGGGGAIFEPKTLSMYTAQQKFSMDFIFVFILVRIRNDFI